MANFPGSISTNANLYIAVTGLQTTLAVACTSGDTTLTLTSTTSFPTTGVVTLDNTEVVSYTGIAGATITGVTRGADGTTAASHPIGVTVGLTVVAAHHNLIKDEVIAVETILGTTLTNAATPAATVTALVARDASANARINHMTENLSSTVTAAGTTTLTAASSRIQQFTGTTTQTVTLPDATTLSIGFQFSILNRSTGTVTVNNNGGSLQSSLPAGAQTVVTCTNVGSANGVWDVSAVAGTGTVTSVSGTANQIASTGGTAPVLSLTSPLDPPGQIQGVVGSTGTPTYSFVGHTNTGMYEVSDTVVFSANGNASFQVAAAELDANTILKMNSNKITGLANGTAASDAVAFNQLKSSSIVGTTTNDNAPAGNIGEYVESVVAAVSFPATTVYGDATSISLTAGDWDVSLNFVYSGAGATVDTDWAIGISITTGNSTTGLVVGSNYKNAISPPMSAANNNGSADVCNWRRSLSGTTTIYAKYAATYTGTTPSAFARLSARRVR